MPQAKKREVVMSSRGGLNVVISLVLGGFLRCHICFVFFHRYLKATLFSLKMKNHTVILLIMGGRNVVISLVLAMILEIHVFSQVRLSLIHI